MSRSNKISPRLSSDFSIERILSEDREKKSHRSFTGSPKIIAPVLNIDDCPRLRSTVEERANPSYSQSLPNYSGSSGATNAVSSSVASSSNRDTTHSKIERNELSWLQCTRYRPPKLPRKSSTGSACKRRPGAHPRIPFTTIQLKLLEDKYRSTAYLSRRDVLQLSTTLRLPQSRVKIWFQNRRARDRRETGISGGNVPILSDQQSLAHRSLRSSNEISSSTRPL